MATPYVTVTLASATSTQDVARARYLEEGRAVLVVAEQQTEGRGRSGRVWTQATQSLNSSLALRLDWPLTQLPAVTLVAGLAVRAALATATASPLTLKWPNDVLVGSSKLAGILVERFDDVIVVGCGANLYWPDRPAGIAALRDARIDNDEAHRLASDWANRFIDRVARGPGNWGRDEYVRWCATVGAEVSWRPDGHGHAVDIGDDGSLIVENDGIRQAIHAGEVDVVRPANVAADQPRHDGAGDR